MRKLIQRMVLLGAVCSASFGGSGLAGTLNFACSSSDNARSYRLMIDLDSDLISRDSGQRARHWAAVVTDKDVSWDEVYDSRIAHIAHHYVLDRATDALHATDMARGGSGRDFVHAACSKAS